MKGKGKGGKGGKGGKAQCSVCGKIGHGPANCWTLHPELMTWKAANAINEEIPGMALGSVESSSFPPGLKSGSRFQALAEEDDEETIIFSLGNLEMEVKQGEKDEWNTVEKKKGKVQEAKRLRRTKAARKVDKQELMALDVLMPGVNSVGEDGGGKRRLVSAGKGEITIDSGAAESVMPATMLPGEPAVEGDAQRAGVQYVAANGAAMPNRGEKLVKFKSTGDGSKGGLNSIRFQVTDVNKPLAAVSRILDQGNTVVFTRNRGRKSYVSNDSTGDKLDIEERKGVFVMPVEYFQPAVAEQGFRGQGI